MPLAGVAVIGRLEHMLGTANDSVELEGETFHADKVAPVGDREAARFFFFKYTLFILRPNSFKRLPIRVAM